jgi:hypothetical protein
MISLIGGTVELSGVLTNEPGGRIVGHGTLTADGGLSNQGDMVFSAVASEVRGETMNDATGSIVVSGGGNVIFWNEFRNAGGLLKVAPDSSARFFGEYTGSGIAGRGDAWFGGTLSPGSSIGVAQFGGSVTLGAACELVIELADCDNSDPLNPRYDALIVDGDVTLGGALALNWLPVEGEASSKFGGVYDILTYRGELEGTFVEFGGSIGGAYIAGIDYAADVVADPNAHAVRLTLHDLIDADTDIDGDVDHDDYVAARDAFGLAAGARWADGDSDFNGTTDWRDYLALKANFGLSLTGEAIALPAAAAQPVPEPTALALLAIGGLAAVLRRRRT